MTNSSVRIGVLGRFQFIKGQDLAIKASRIVAERFPDKKIVLQMCGSVNDEYKKDVDYFSQIMRDASSRKIGQLSVEFLSHSNNPLSFIDEQDLILVPSRYESFSMTTIEALARGKPVVVPDIGGPKEIIGAREDVGLMFDPCSAESIADSITRVLAGHRFNASDSTSRPSLLLARLMVKVLELSIF
ncbi:glycosyltransferase family 4 protein [Cupriavidus basilensis]|nr:glycosyltransferase family 4 protein [Cupriavidus basilensis]